MSTSNIVLNFIWKKTFFNIIFGVNFSCIDANLNGVYQSTPYNNNYIGIIWDRWLGDYSLKSAKMLIRPKIPFNEEPEELSANAKPLQLELLH